MGKVIQFPARRAASGTPAKAEVAPVVELVPFGAVTRSERQRARRASQFSAAEIAEVRGWEERHPVEAMP